MIRLIDIMFLVAAVAGGMWVGSRFGSPYGKIGVVAGFIIGAIATLAALFGFIKLLLILAAKGWPSFPICKNGKCKEDDYEYIESSDNGVIFKCKCGEKYIMKKKSPLGRYIKACELLEDGSTRPYMKYVRYFRIFGRWVKEL